MDNHKINAVLS